MDLGVNDYRADHDHERDQRKYVFSHFYKLSKSGVHSKAPNGLVMEKFYDHVMG